MAYLGQPFPDISLGNGKPLRHYSMGMFTSQGLDSIIQDAKNLVYNAAWGELTKDQVNAIKAETNAQIIQAAHGNAALAAAAQAQASSEIDAAAAAPGGSSITNFLQNNWPWLLLAGGATYYALRA